MKIQTAEDARLYTAGYAAALEELCNVFDRLLTHGHPPQRVINILYDVLYQKAGQARRNAELWE